MTTLNFVPVNTKGLINTTADLAQIIWLEHFPSVISVEQIEYMLASYQSPEAITAEIVQGAQYELVLAHDTMIAYLAYDFTECPVGKISKLYLLASFRGKGYGRAMIEHIESEARQSGITKLWLQTNRNNTQSIAFYERIGYRLEREKRTPIGQGFVMDDFIYARELSN